MRRQTKEVKIGSVTIGGENPIAIQSMLCAPLGDLAGTTALLIQGSPDVAWTVEHSTPSGSYVFSTAEVQEILGEDIPLNAPEVFAWMSEYLAEQEQSVGEGSAPPAPGEPAV